MGDVLGDMNRRRARVLGMEQVEDGQKVSVEVPMAEILDYPISLRSMTQAKGSFTQEFVRYDEVPQHMANKIIAEAASEAE